MNELDQIASNEPLAMSVDSACITRLYLRYRARQSTRIKHAQRDMKQPYGDPRTYRISLCREHEIAMAFLFTNDYDL